MARNTSEISICVACKEKFIPDSNAQYACKICVPTKGWQARFRRYGVTKPIFDEILMLQDGQCPLCLCEINEETACIDHCHNSLKFRGILCRGCNMVLSRFEDQEYKKRVELYLAEGGDLHCVSEKEEKSHISRL